MGPATLRTVDDDAGLVEALSDGSNVPTAVSGGDLARTMGTQSPATRDEIGEFPIDLIQVTLDDGIERTACAHVVARPPWWRGSWWTGPVLAVMNAEFLGDRDVAPRGHPNDGRVETLECESSFPIRQRFAVSRRLRSGTHLPHPAITARSVRRAAWTFKRSVIVFVDGRNVGQSHTIEVVVLPDATKIYR